MAFRVAHHHVEWLGRLNCCATGLDASLSFCSTSRRCSRKRSPNLLKRITACQNLDNQPSTHKNHLQGDCGH